VSRSFLQRVTAARRADAEARRASGALDVARESARNVAPPRDFTAALATPGISLIAEVKRASPSAGDIAPDVDRLELVAAYERGGAAAISVLTEPEYFRGSLEDLSAVRASVGIPVLRKDFICDPLQVWEARAAGADAVLLIVAVLDQTELVSLAGLVDALGMTALIEVHDEADMARAADAGARVVGINTRDLATLRVDPTVVARLRPFAPQGALVVGESGVSVRADVVRLEGVGCDAVLVGEALVRAPDPAAKVRELLGR